MDGSHLRVFVGDDEPATVLVPFDAQPVESDIDEARAKTLLDAYLKEARPETMARWEVKPGEFASGRAILESELNIQAGAAVLSIQQIAKFTASSPYSFGGGCTRQMALKGLLIRLLRRQLPLGDDGICRILNCARGPSPRAAWDMPLGTILGAVRRHIDEHGMSKGVRSRLEQLRAQLRGSSECEYAEGRKLLRRFDEMFGQSPSKNIKPGRPWADAALAALSEMNDQQRTAWDELLAYAAGANASKPSQKWLIAAREKIDAVGATQFAELAAQWFSLVGQPGKQPWQRRHWWEADPNSLLIEGNVDVLKGLAWCAIEAGDSRLCRALANMGQACLTKIRNHGPRSKKLGNACIVVLGAMGKEGVAQLARLRLKVKYSSAQKLIVRSLEAAAKVAGISRDELEELAVPGFGLEADGCRRETLGDFTAELHIIGPDKCEIRWIKPDGKPQQSVPAAVKRDFADELKELKQAVKDISSLLPGQRDRLERFMRQDRQWSLAAWRERYLDHPLVGTLARRLIWRFTNNDQSTLGMSHDGHLVDADDDSISELTDTTAVSIWHPIDSDVNEVRAWRDFLTNHEITQPFKQAHREIYVLTDAERETHVYSNRFASHLLKQHQFSALCQQRGWQYHLQGAWDSHNVPTLDLSEHGLRVEYWVDPANAEDGEGYTSEMGIFLYVVTDQVRFYREEDQVPMSLTDVPSSIFSEVMRDVDLFVGVCSVGNDPQWRDNGPEGFTDYWENHAFGDLSETAKTRREVLQRLLPRLKIASRTELSGNYLIVHGKLRTYKIHLGSANVMMEPNSQYLCIVVDRAPRKGPNRVFLPFEGDTTLAIILSKAFLLADDTKITDPSIVHQIR